MVQLQKGETKTCDVLLDEFQNKEQPSHPERITFKTSDDKDVYNITAPFMDDDELVIAGRVEPRDSEHSDINFFVNRHGEWTPKEGAPVFHLQDPFFTRINDELVLGGVQIFPHPTVENALGWRTVFYKGKNILELKEFATGPDGMKDLRLIQLQDGSIGILTRPQGEKGGRGKIGFTRISSLDEFNLDVIDNAPLLKGQFIEDEWGGANELHLLSNGLIGVLGHIACFDKSGGRHYYPMAFAISPENGTYSDIQMIATRSHFLDGPAKHPELIDVVFSGGLVRKQDGTADLYAGISDADAQKITIKDPFLQFEQL